MAAITDTAASGPAPPPVCRRLGRPAHLLRIFHTLRHPVRGPRVWKILQEQGKGLLENLWHPVRGPGFLNKPFLISRWAGWLGGGHDFRAGSRLGPLAQCVFLLAGPAAPFPDERCQRRAVVQKAASPMDWRLQVRPPGRLHPVEAPCGTSSHGLRSLVVGWRIPRKSF